MTKSGSENEKYKKCYHPGLLKGRNKLEQYGREQDGRKKEI
jgi:hypothetical protein